MKTIDSDPTATMEAEHAAGCTYGGFSCGYWLRSERCSEEHWEKHYVLANGRCPCDIEFPGAANIEVFFDASCSDE